MSVSLPLVYFPNTGQSIVWQVVIASSILNITPTPVTDATGNATLFDENGTPVPGAVDIAFVPVPSDPNNPQSGEGWYAAPINQELFSPPCGDKYNTLITMNSSLLGQPAQWNVPSQVSLAGPR